MSPAQATPGGEVLDRFYAAIARGDVGAARACCKPHAVFWHGFDRLEEDLDKQAATWAGLSRLSDITFPVQARFPVPGGLVQRHGMEATAPTGERIGWAICVFVTIEDGLIVRLDEYIDRAAHPLDGRRQEAAAP